MFTLDRAVDLSGVWFRYETGSFWALKNLHITIPARKITAITGHSGAGKTTLADLLLGLLTPTEGEVLIDDNFINHEHSNLWRQNVGYVPQETYLFHESIRDNLKKASPLATEDQLWQALEKASAKTFVEGLSDRLDTVVGDRGIRLSGGERQRIALARALLRDPLLLVLDEATSALDNENERHIQSALIKLKQQLTIVIIAHRDSTVELADHVIRLEHGTNQRFSKERRVS